MQEHYPVNPHPLTPSSMQYLYYTLLTIIGLCLAFFWYEALCDFWLRCFGKKRIATITKIYEKHHEHEPDEDCCGGPGVSLVVEAEWRDAQSGEVQTFKKHTLLPDRYRLEGKKHITVYVSRRDKTKYWMNLESAR